MLLWTPEGSEGQSLHLWLAASCHSARPGRAGEKVSEEAAKNYSNNIPIQNKTNDKRKKYNNNNFFFKKDSQEVGVRGMQQLCYCRGSEEAEGRQRATGEEGEKQWRLGTVMKMEEQSCEQRRKGPRGGG